MNIFTENSRKVPTGPKRQLKLALIHLNVHYKKPERNRGHFLALVEKAAKQDANIVVGPELAISGYSFDNRHDIAPYTETVTGPTLTALAEIASRYHIFVCVGLAERDDQTGIYYNSAFVLNPEGHYSMLYRKINAESKWACPGNHLQDNTFETPWGRVGILICSDSYYGLMPRVTAMRGADLIIVPANWPPSGLDPHELWRARALENGIYLAACNRTGVDRIMDCRQAASGVYDPDGHALLIDQNEHSTIFFADLPLTSNGRLDNQARLKKMADREPNYYHDCYLNLRIIQNLTEFLELPEPGTININCLVPELNEHPVDALEKTIKTDAMDTTGLYLLPSFNYSDASLEKIGQVATQKKIGIVTARPCKTEERDYIFHHNTDGQCWRLSSGTSNGRSDLPTIDYGPARLKLAPFKTLTHPELALAFSKQGGDLAIAVEDELLPGYELLAGVRTIENIALAVCAQKNAGIWLPTKGHQRWQEFTAKSGSSCHCRLDTQQWRERKYQDAVDFELLLSQS